MENSISTVWKGRRASLKGVTINHVDSLGEGVSQISILLHKAYLVKVPRKEEGGGQNIQKFDHVVYG